VKRREWDQGDRPREALRELGLSADNVVGIGDAENDHAFLNLCECRIAVAVANAVPMLKDATDFVTKHDHDAGVGALIERLIAPVCAISRHESLGLSQRSGCVRVRPARAQEHLCQPPGGPSDEAFALLRNRERYCVFDANRQLLIPLLRGTEGIERFLESLWPNVFRISIRHWVASEITDELGIFQRLKEAGFCPGRVVVFPNAEAFERPGLTSARCEPVARHEVLVVVAGERRVFRC
jgi:hypothetical protein